MIGFMAQTLLANVNAKVIAHEDLDTERFNRMEKDQNVRHSENRDKLDRLTRSQSRQTGALMVALSSSATPEERREMMRDLREDV